METLGNTDVVKSRKQKLRCEACDYTSSRKQDYEKHLATGKHIKRVIAVRSPHTSACGKVFTRSDSLYRHKKGCDVCRKTAAKVAEVAECFQAFPEEQNRHVCGCGSTYRTRSGLWKHKKTCLHDEGAVEGATVNNAEVLEVLQLLHAKMEMADAKMDMATAKMEMADAELKSIKTGVLTAVAEPKVVNNYNYNNINLFLNERCADAQPIQDFVGGLAIGMEDVNYALENGKANGIANIIEKRIDELGMYKRPLHCTDVKRGTMYVKGVEGWGKEKGEMTKLIQDVNHAQVKGIKIWEAAHPRCFDAGYDREKDKWFKIVKCLTNDIAGVGTRKISKRCYEVSKINQEEMI